MLPTDTDPDNKKGTLCPTGWTDHPQNVPDCSLCHSQNILTISSKSTPRFYGGVADKHAQGAQMGDR